MLEQKVFNITTFKFCW